MNLIATGSLRIQGLSYNTSTRTLTCVSSGGPVTTVQWLLEGNSLNQSDQSTYIADRETGRYRHTLRLMSAGSGLYSCVVENTQGNTSQDLQRETCSITFNTRSIIMSSLLQCALRDH